MSCINNYGDINETFIIEPASSTGDTPIYSACTAFFTNLIIGCDNDTEIALITGATVFNRDIIPSVDYTTDVGTSIRRFRNINTVSGTSSVWVSTVSVTTPTLNLGLDSQGYSRIITANSSVIQDDELNGGGY